MTSHRSGKPKSSKMNEILSIKEQYLFAFESWYKSLRIVKANKGPSTGTIASTLILLERLKRDYDLCVDNHISSGGIQIKGVSGTALASILHKFGETRHFAKEGGRTNRGVLGDVRPLFDKLVELNLDELPKHERNDILESFQSFLVERIKILCKPRKIKLKFDPKLSTWHLMQTLVLEATKEGKAGHVSQHIVGAKLQLRFPSLEIVNESVSTADQPTDRAGDFLVGDTVFHVTMAPMQAVFEKCQHNIAEGYKAFLIVPDSKLAAARQMAEQFCNGYLAVESLESFISQNLEEISTFTGSRLKTSLAQLIELYNERVDAVEIDKSLMIELPASLRK
jgi:hypothetical protein